MALTVDQNVERKQAVHLRFDGGKVLITPEDHPRFMMAAEKAVDVLQKEQAREELMRQFNDHFLPFLNAWCESQNHRVQACYLGTPTPFGLTVFVIGKHQYDFSLGDEISRFALQLENEGWPSNILQIPDGDEEDLAAFFNPESSLQVYAQTKSLILDIDNSQLQKRRDS
jgi:hypothetical protein